MNNLEYFNQVLALTEKAVEDGIKDSLKKLQQQEQEQEQDTAA